MRNLAMAVPQGYLKRPRRNSQKPKPDTDTGRGKQTKLECLFKLYCPLISFFLIQLFHSFTIPNY